MQSFPRMMHINYQSSGSTTPDEHIRGVVTQSLPILCSGGKKYKLLPDEHIRHDHPDEHQRWRGAILILPCSRCFPLDV